MKFFAVLLLSTLSTFTAFRAWAIPPQEVQDRKEMAQVWVDRHNGDLSDDAKAYFKAIKFKKHAFYASSWHKPVVRMKRLSTGQAARMGVPASVNHKDGSIVPLTSLYVSHASNEEFLTANYSDEIDRLHCSTDIYIKIGLQYRHLFHGEGYPGCARVLSLGKDLPAFFEVSTYGGGTRCDRTIYRLDTEAIKAKNDELYDHPELIDVQKYVKDELEIHNWLEGFTAYKDVNKDGTLEVINSSVVLYPPDLKTKVKERYKMVDNDFGAFRQTAVIYQWDDGKSKFVPLGEHFY
ncbi:MAG TPA: hypothetical protein VHE12_08805 [bacterium]|nr:hypothetical protein [bacterium]